MFSALFAGLEIAYISANKLKFEVDKNKGLLAGRILSDLSRFPSLFIAAMLLGNNITLIIYGIEIARILDPALMAILPDFMNGPWWILVFQTLISTFIVLITAEFIPKSLFRINPNLVLNVLAIPAWFFFYFFYPFILFFTKLSEFLLKRIIRTELSGTDLGFTTVDLDQYIREFSRDREEESEINSEIQMFQNAIDFKNIKIRECMVPRTEIKALEDTEDPDVVRNTMIQTGHSKILIYKESIDDICGYVHSFDLFKNPATIQEILKPILIVPESMAANTALTLLIEQRKSVALVVDEFGGTSGMVTMEDIIEEIFGEIRDEFDLDSLIERQTGRNTYIFAGRLEIDYLNEKYKLGLPESEDYETLAGLIIYHHESIPSHNDEIIVGSFVFTILEVNEIRIGLVQLSTEA
jgi:putative hemolysin